MKLTYHQYCAYGNDCGGRDRGRRDSPRVRVDPPSQVASTVTPPVFRSTTAATATQTTTAARATATAMSRAPERVLLAVVAGTIIVAVLAAVAVASGSGSGGSASPTLWRHATISSGDATLAYPSGWKAIPGDTGTVSFATRDRVGRYLGYLNVTPRQGAEQLAGWAAFRAGRNAAEGDKQVQILNSAENLKFANARGSCVTDDYLSKVGGNPYRELACIVAGRHGTDVFVGAALSREWAGLGPIVMRSAATLVER